MPPIYNSARLHEQPIAPTEFVDANQYDSTTHDLDVPTENNANEPDVIETLSTDELIAGDPEVDVNNSANGLNGVPNEKEANEHERVDDLESTFFDSNEQNGSSRFDVKPRIEDDQEDLAAYAQLCDDTNAGAIDPLIGEQQESVASNVSTVDATEMRESFAKGIRIESTRISDKDIPENIGFEGENGSTSSANNDAQN